MSFPPIFPNRPLNYSLKSKNFQIETVFAIFGAIPIENNYASQFYKVVSIRLFLADRRDLQAEWRSKRD